MNNRKIRLIQKAVLLILITNIPVLSFACGGPSYGYEPDINYFELYHFDPDATVEENIQYIDAAYSYSRLSTILAANTMTVSNKASNLDQNKSDLYKRFINSVNEKLIENGRNIRVYDYQKKERSETEQNILFLHLRERESEYYICQSNNYSSAMSFIDSVIKAELYDAQVAMLISARGKLLNMDSCDTSKKFETVLASLKILTSQENSKHSNEYVNYLNGAYSFYSQDFDSALGYFSKLADITSEQWLKEASSYMKGRTKLVQAQREWNGNRGIDNVNQAEVLEAELYFSDYLKNYPVGTYATSAYGFGTRLLLLQGDYVNLSQRVGDNLNKAYQIYFEQKKPQFNYYPSYYLAYNEWLRFRTKNYNYSETNSPAVFSYYILNDSGKKYTEKLKIIESSQQKKSIKQLLISYLYYQNKKYDASVKILESISELNASDPISVGLWITKAKSYAKTGNSQASLNIWKNLATKNELEISHDHIQYNIAQIFIQTNNLKQLSEVEKVCCSEELYIEIFSTICDEKILVDIINNKLSNTVAKIAARTELFTRYIVLEKYTELHQLYSKVKDTDHFSLIRTAARKLSKNPNDVNGLLNIGYFLHTQMSAPLRIKYHAELIANKNYENCPFNYRHNSYRGPLYFYSKVIDLHNKGKRSTDEAKALHYYIGCFKKGGGNCFRDNYNGLSNKKLFQKLHQKYKNSKWADKTEYYY
ncbi:MAG: hypothetical protein ACC657_12465 [Thiohalomonadales bacterium]